ncbi:EamA family transporter [Stenotrophomonas sp. YIM B06876]|uniref:EamA family transporter n=1 Tax=Stenotrophomonas sp. YIM B06876 TaxID=3060211 RepID=UPI00273A1EDB|nr:EamA family transporter [Stenotrophomonas sp. YIM B06876]
MSYIFIALTILLTVYGQLMLKWQVNLNPGATIDGLNPRAVITLLLNPWVISAFAAAFGASLCWMAAIGRMPLSKAYPFTALSFPLVATLAVWLFRESLDSHKIAGTALIILGVIVLSRSGA